MATASPTMLAPVRQWIGAWYDSEHAVAILLGLFVVVWTAFQVISFASLDLHPDVIEVFVWGSHPSLGYYKHPPLGGLMAGAWFAIFPAADWSAHLLAMVNAALSLYFVDLIARRYLTGDKRLMVLLLLLLTPFYQFHAVRFGSNQTLLLTWPLAVYCFIRAFESRGLAWSIAAGAAAALAVLGKYFSIFLVGGIAIAALVHPDRMKYLRSPSPWLSMAVGLTVLAPHVHWLFTTGFQPFAYADTVHVVSSPLAAMSSVPIYLTGALGYVSVAAIVFWLATRPRPADVWAALWPRDPDRRMLAALLWAPLLLPAITTPLTRGNITPLWTMQSWFLLPILLLMPERIGLRRSAAIGAAVAVAAYTLVVVLSSPVLALLKHRNLDRDGRNYFSLVAKELTRRWNAETGRPLKIVLGQPYFSIAAAYYSPDHPDSVPYFAISATPWVTRERMAREGFAAICRDEACATTALGLAADHPGAHREEIEIRRTFLGAPGQPARFTLVLAPPKSAQ
jgi:4-amino-4-deoxy-L-arabinose transferase-like glycosyltransferase